MIFGSLLAARFARRTAAADRDLRGAGRASFFLDLVVFLCFLESLVTVGAGITASLASPVVGITAAWTSAAVGVSTWSSLELQFGSTAGRVKAGRDRRERGQWQQGRGEIPARWWLGLVEVVGEWPRCGRCGLTFGDPLLCGLGEDCWQVLQLGEVRVGGCRASHGL
jgi:hypothetical protein